MLSILHCCQPSKKSLFLVPIVFLCLVGFTVFSLDCLSSQDQNYLCPIFFSKHAPAFESFANGIEDSTNTEMPTVVLDANSFVLPAVDDTNNVIAPAVDDTNSLLAPAADDTNNLVVPAVDDTNSLMAPVVDETSNLMVPAVDDTNSLMAPIVDDTNSLLAPAVDDTNNLISPAIDDTNSLLAPDVDDANNLMVPTVDDRNSLMAPAVDDTNSLVAPDVDNSLLSTSSDNSNKVFQHEKEIEVTKLQRKIDDINTKQIVLNIDKFGSITDDTIVIVIQVQQQLEYLQALLESLQHAKYIERTLLVFSHRFYSVEINNVVQNIEFARFIQIFFPYSLQTHPNTFPGFSPDDCPYKTQKKTIEKIKCQGQPRDVESLQEKHNWWWTVNMVFNGLTITKEFHGLVLFLEEDHYVLPDVIHVLRLMRQIAPDKCPDCNLFGLGLSPKYTTIEDYRGGANKLHVFQWKNMGFAFNRQFWAGLSSQKCSVMFCEYNDHNWNYTLTYLSHKCLPHRLKPLNVLSSRIFQIGDCKKYFPGKDCSLQTFLQLMDNLQQDVSQFLFPPELTVLSTHHHPQRIHRHKGGWDDPRDIQLCKNITQQLHW